MSEAFTGELRIFGFNFPPLNWATCDGSLMPITRNTALFSLLGTNFGGNGTTTFGLPNLQGNLPVGAGTAVTGTQYAVGETGGEITVTIGTANAPAHTHAFNAAAGRGVVGNSNTPGPKNSFTTATGCTPYLAPATTATMAAMDPNALSPWGAASPAPHTNLMPTITMNFCICLSGIFPPRP